MGQTNLGVLIKNNTTFHIGNHSFETYYPGPGHTLDNIVIWFKKEKILYAGCLIKGLDADNLGYLGDGNEMAYLHTLQNLQKKYPNPQYIVVTHSQGTSVKAMIHSLKMAQKLRQH